VGQFLPERFPVCAVEVERVDVLILLRRVLGVVYRSVGAMLDPFGVLAAPRMIGRGLERDVERHLEAEVIGRGDEAIEVLDRPKSWLDCRMTAFLGSDRPRAPQIARF